MLKQNVPTVLPPLAVARRFETLPLTPSDPAINMPLRWWCPNVPNTGAESSRLAFRCRRMPEFVGLGCLLVLLAVTGAGCQSQPQETAPGRSQEASEHVIDQEEADVALRQLLGDQQEAWNRGDLEGFMAGYAQTDTLRFASGGSVRTGWQEALDSYRSGYPDRAAMGELTFDDVDVQVMTKEWALIFGRWTLEREKDRPSGLFTLIAHRKGPSSEWKIVHDHTSSAPPEEAESE